jgi:hypothetical protein
MKNPMFKPAIALALAIITIPVLINFVCDIISYHACASSQTYFTPWYDDDWRKDPYTKFCLSWHPAKYHIATNGVGDLWVVKEVKVGQVEFWTVKYKVEKKDLK